MAACLNSELQEPGEAYEGAPLAAIAPIAGVVFTAFFVIGLALPVLPLHVHDDLGMGAFVVGLVAGCQFVASLVSRLSAGRITDTRGPKRAVLLGLAAAVAGGACYLLSLMFTRTPMVSVGILLAGRSLAGGAESLIITGGILWSLGRVAPGRAAQVIAWAGMSMFAAIAVGAPIGSLVFGKFGFSESRSQAHSSRCFRSHSSRRSDPWRRLRLPRLPFRRCSERCCCRAPASR